MKSLYFTCFLFLLVITVDDTTPEQAAQLETLRDAYKNTQNPAWIRDSHEITAWFDGFALVEPGLVHLTDWRPDEISSRHQLELETDVRPFYWCAVGQKHH